MALPSEPGTSEAQSFVDQFDQYIDANVAGTAAVLENLPAPYSEVVQYAIQGVAFDVSPTLLLSPILSPLDPTISFPRYYYCRKSLFWITYA